jgi:hypothetical protein
MGVGGSGAGGGGVNGRGMDSSPVPAGRMAVDGRGVVRSGVRSTVHRGVSRCSVSGSRMGVRGSVVLAAHPMGGLSRVVGSLAGVVGSNGSMRGGLLRSFFSYHFGGVPASVRSSCCVQRSGLPVVMHRANGVGRGDGGCVAADPPDIDEHHQDEEPHIHEGLHPAAIIGRKKARSSERRLVVRGETLDLRPFRVSRVWDLLR